MILTQKNMTYVQLILKDFDVLPFDKNNESIIAKKVCEEVVFNLLLYTYDVEKFRVFIEKNINNKKSFLGLKNIIPKMTSKKLKEILIAKDSTQLYDIIRFIFIFYIKFYYKKRIELISSRPFFTYLKQYIYITRNELKNKMSKGNILVDLIYESILFFMIKNKNLAADIYKYKNENIISTVTKMKTSLYFENIYETIKMELHKYQISHKFESFYKEVFNDGVEIKDDASFINKIENILHLVYTVIYQYKVQFKPNKEIRVLKFFITKTLKEKKDIIN